MFQDDPSSRIFAPLAECYRKIGLVDQAIDICKEGMIIHPDFTGGKVAMARAYFDKKKYVLVRDLLLPIIDSIPDNLIAQRLLADSCFLLGQSSEALNAYKMLLYFNPNDAEVAELVQDLETKSYQAWGLLKSPDRMKKLVKLQTLLSKVQRLKPSLANSFKSN